jgi:hypothetical protein
MSFDLKRVTPYLPWIERGVLLLVILCFVLFWNWNSREKARLAQEVESWKLKSQGYADDDEKRQRELDRLSKEFLKKDGEWAGQVKQLEKLLGETPKVIRIVEIRTEPGPVNPLPPGTPPRECPTDGKKIILVEGDKVHAELKEIDWGTDSKNTVMTGRISCLRDTAGGPGPT